MKRLNINFAFLIAAVLSLLFLEGGLLFRVFTAYLGENMVSSIVGVICLQAGFFAVALNREEKHQKFRIEYGFVLFGAILLTAHNIYHTIDILHTLKYNGLPQFVIGITSGIFIPIMGAVLLDLLALKICKQANEKSEVLRLQSELKNAWDKANENDNTLQQEIAKRNKEIYDLQQAVNTEKKRCADLAGAKSGKEVIIGELQKEYEKLKAQHANELLKVVQEKGKDSGELGEMRALNEMNAKEIKRLNSVIEEKERAYKGLNELCNDFERRAKLLEGIKDNMKTLQLEVSAKDLELNELRGKIKPMYIFENYIKEYNRAMKIPKNQTGIDGEDRYSIIEKLLGLEVVEIVKQSERNGNKGA